MGFSPWSFLWVSGKHTVLHCATLYYMGKDTMTVRIDPAVREDLDAIASAADRDRTWVVNQALTAYLETYRWQIEHIRQGLREAEAGQFASPAAVKKAMRRLLRK